MMCKDSVEASSVFCKVCWGKGERQQLSEAGFFVTSIRLRQVNSPVFSKLEGKKHGSEGETINMQVTDSVIARMKPESI